MNIRSKDTLKNLRGISLIVLIITIIVSVILISTVLLTLDKNDPRKGATESVFKSDFRVLQQELAMKKAEVKKEDTTADINVSITYDEEEELKKWINSIDTSILNGIVEICNGELVFIDNGMSEEEKEWAKDMTALIDSCEEYSKKRGGLYFKGEADGNEVESYTWTNKDVTVSVDTTQAEDLLDKYDSYIYSIDYNEYKDYTTPFIISTSDNTVKTAKIKGVAKSSSDESVEPIEFIEEYVVKIDKIKPTAPDITKSELGTKMQIILSGAKDEDSGIEKLEYSLDGGSTWQEYTTSVIINNDITQIYSRAWDNAGNVTSEAEYKKININ